MLKELNRLIRQRFVRLDKLVGEPLTVTDLKQSGEMLVAVSFRRERITIVMRWGWKRFEEGSYRWFWPLIPGSMEPPDDWGTYGTRWQAYRIDFPADIRGIAVLTQGAEDPYEA